MNFKSRSYKLELLDGENIPFEDIYQNMKELDFINTWLGGHGITLDGFKKLIANKKHITICEIGCGGGDNLAYLKRWCLKKGIQLSCIGIDIKQECLAVAKANLMFDKNDQWICNDYACHQFIEKPTIIFSSLFCHHFTNTQIVDQLNWMKENATIGFFINDLHRNFIAYYSIKMLTNLFSKSYLVKNDAALSVARGFVKHEWISLFKTANIVNPAIQWKWAFRYLIIYKNNE